MGKIRQLFNDLNNGTRFFLLLLLTAIIGILYFNLSGSLLKTLVASIISFFILWLTKNVWTPREYRKPILINFSVGGFIASAALLISNYSKFKDILKPFYNTVTPLLDSFFQGIPVLRFIKVSPDLISSLIVVVLVILLFLVNYVFRNDTIILPHELKISEEFKELGFSKKLLAISDSLRNELERIDRDTNWSDYFFIPVEAEVEIYHNNKNEKKVTDLMKALKRNKHSDTFLVLGDPGAGKSVALRKLCKDINKEVGTTGRIAIYVNLKEWEVVQPWTEKSPPSISDLQQFIQENIKSKLDIFGNQFFKDNYVKLHEQGRIYYILDSFDEIPAMLDAGEFSWLVDHLSHIIFQFITSGYQSRGILASRLFRKPTKNFAARSVLEIRPLSDFRIKQNLERSGAFNDQSVKYLYRERSDLVPLASNPFMAALLINYIKANEGRLPELRSELFRSYIDSRLAASEERILEKRLTRVDVLEYSSSIADLMFSEQKYGLEIPLNDLVEFYRQQPVRIEYVVHILTYARIGRLGTGVRNMFSFVHRRFNEYFVVQSLIKSDNKINLSSIPSDSRYRDALVLYCEVVSLEKAISIASFCWQYIKAFENEQLQLTEEKHLEAVLCLRFLRDAFLLRKECLNGFKDELSVFIFNQLNSNNYIVKKIAVESGGLLDKEALESAILIALKTNNPPIQEAAFKAAKYVKSIHRQLENTLLKYLLSFDSLDLIRRRNELLFALKLSPVLKRVLRATTIIELDQFAFAFGCVLLMIKVQTALILVGYFGYYSMIYYGKEYIYSLGGGIEGLIKIKYSKKRPKVEPKDPKKFKSFLPMQLVMTIMLRIMLSVIVLGLILWLPSEDIGRMFRLLVWTGSTLVFPFFKIYLLIRTITIYLTRKKILSFLVILLGSAAVYAAFVFLAIYSKSMFLAYTFLIIIGILAVLIAFLAIVNYFKAEASLKSIQYFDNMEREKISRLFNSFHFARHRIKFVKELEKNVNKVIGHWPDNILPNSRNDYSSILLMQLEEKWLGLNR